MSKTSRLRINYLFILILLRKLMFLVSGVCELESSREGGGGGDHRVEAGPEEGEENHGGGGNDCSVHTRSALE